MWYDKESKINVRTERGSSVQYLQTDFFILLYTIPYKFIVHNDFYKIEYSNYCNRIRIPEDRLFLRYCIATIPT